MNNWTFEVRNLICHFDKHSEKKILYPNFTIQKNKITIIKGRTGCGKTTLLNLLGLMDDVDLTNEGIIKFKPDIDKEPISYKELFNQSESELENIRREYFGFMFQQDQLIDALPGWDNVFIPYVLKNTKATLEEAKKAAKSFITKFHFEDMTDDLMDRSPSTYSGGQRQRAALIRALIHNPKVIFADEPLASVDRVTATEIIDVLHQQTKNDTTVIMIVHDTHEFLFDKYDVNEVIIKNE